MAALEIPLRHTWVSCPEGRLVIRPAQADGHEALPLDINGLALTADEIQVGVGTTRNVLVQFRDELRPHVFEHILMVEERTGLWIGDIEGTSGVDLAARPGRYLLTGWLDQTDAPHGLLVNLGIRRA